MNPEFRLIYPQAALIIMGVMMLLLEPQMVFLQGLTWAALIFGVLPFFYARPLQTIEANRIALKDSPVPGVAFLHEHYVILMLGSAVVIAAVLALV